MPLVVAVFSVVVLVSKVLHDKQNLLGTLRCYRVPLVADLLAVFGVEIPAGHCSRRYNQQMTTNH